MDQDLNQALKDYASQVIPLSQAATTTEASYYPAIRSLLVDILRSLRLPDDVRVNTSERRSRGGRDVPDVALYDTGSDFIVVSGEVKRPGENLADIAVSTERNDQMGRYLAQTKVVLISNVRSFGLVLIDSDEDFDGPVPPGRRRLDLPVDLWVSEASLRRGDSPNRDALSRLTELVETAVISFAPIAEPDTLARVLALQARRAKEALPARFSNAVQGLANDFADALGITFSGEEGEEFFRSSLIQTVYYGLFAGWILWAREETTESFDWRDLPRYLTIPFLGELFYEIQHPKRISELGLRSRLDLASATLERVDRDRFFSRIQLPHLGEGEDPERAAATAIVYFYEPFLETFDPDLRKELGVWYTPPEIVRYQVRKINQLLIEELDCERGLADNRVVILDPGCGTGAYLIEILNCIAEALRLEGIEAELGATLLKAVHERIFGFEILTAPFVVSHLQLHLILSSLGTSSDGEERPGIFLTNALTGWEEATQVSLHFPELQEEHDAAQRVKQEAPILVICGNPPYNRFAGAAIEEERSLVDPYKGIDRDSGGRQIGSTELYTRWGIRKQLLDDLYIRFFRIAEQRIGEKAVQGIVSYISNSSYLTGRSHPLMREHLLRNFSELWIDNLHGNRLASERTPWGDSCETVFNMPSGGPGIKVGTAITTMLKREGETEPPEETPINVRDFWGSAEGKRKSLLHAIEFDQWTEERQKEQVTSRSGPHPYNRFFATVRARWKLVPYESVGSYDEWMSLDEIFEVGFQGVNPNRGIHGSVIDVNRNDLVTRMKDYYSNQSFEELCRRHPTLCQNRARYDAQETREALRNHAEFEDERVVEYALFPLDGRYLYYETREKLLNECRPELWENIDNEFLVAVPEPRRASETLPLFATTAFDLHLHDRGSVGFPAVVKEDGTVDLFTKDEGESSTTKANFVGLLWRVLQKEWQVEGRLSSVVAKDCARRMQKVCLAIAHAPAYQEDHHESLKHDWAHIPVPRDVELFNKIAEVGEQLSVLLDPFASARPVIHKVIGAERAAGLAVLAREGQGPIQSSDLVVDISYYGSATGRWAERSIAEGDAEDRAWGTSTGDLYLNEEILLENVPERIWKYELGGYPVLQKWLGYRHKRFRDGAPLSLEEKETFRKIVQRIASILILHPQLDNLYREAAAAPWVGEDVEGIRGSL